MDYTSPDFIMDSTVSSAADMFSLGLVILALYNSPHTSPLRTNSNVSTYKKLFASSSSAPSPTNNFLSSRPLPKDLCASVLPRLITRRPAQRMNAREFQQSQFFDNVLVSSIRFLDSLPTKTPNEKSQYMKGLPKVLSQFPRSVLERKILPALLDELKDREILFLILQNVFIIIKSLPQGRRAFTEKVIPKLRETFIISKGPSNERNTAKEAGLVVVIENIELIGERCSGKEFKEDILPIIQLGLESHTHAIVDKSLGCLPTIMAVLDFSTIKNEVFPIVAAVFSKTSSLGIKIRGLQAFVVLCGGLSDMGQHLSDGLDGAVQSTKIASTNNNAVLDKYTVQEKIVPLLKAMKTKEPAVMMAALALLKQVGRVVDTDFLATECLPILWAFGLGPLLNLQQFQEYMALIKALSTRIENEQMRKLRELSSTSGINRSDDLMNMGTTDALFGTNGEDVGESDFERLVLGRGVSNRNTSDTLGDSLRPQPQQRSQSSRAATPVFSWSTTNSASAQDNGDGLPAVNGLGHPQNPTLPPASSVTALDSFAALKPVAPVSAGLGNTMNGFGAMTPMQPSNLQPSSLSNQARLLPTQSVSPSYAQTQSNFSVLPNSTSPFSQFSIAPPPAPTMWPMQNRYGNGMGGSGTRTDGAPKAAQPAQKKSGLDAYESLL